ncbi:BMC domain-containing protein [Pseudoramibacter sp.]|jgi:hypothetical protein|uniref:BMC domain-containing protein n=1 Tax=Pseudoramibacter sp. TaxID=2034862 RepID=UPI0025F91B5D|nr:BMC domain-containing protein [Pseudoramibacter sp.]MCH4071502.1 BMC domain-containing protein [Pseudoramibacter sp.]MCH4105270.1 BMC domain-containing protein [Pseudoramibacter sp.]
MNIKYQFISKPDDNTIRIIRGKMRPDQRKAMDEMNGEGVGAVLLLQGSIPDMLYSADIAVKASDVGAYEIVGNCPQSFITIGVMGKIRSVQTALKAILNKKDHPSREQVLAGIQ